MRRTVGSRHWDSSFVDARWTPDTVRDRSCAANRLVSSVHGGRRVVTDPVTAAILEGREARWPGTLDEWIRRRSVTGKAAARYWGFLCLHPIHAALCHSVQPILPPSGSHFQNRVPNPARIVLLPLK